jgi:hypothetical protein
MVIGSKIYKKYQLKNLILKPNWMNYIEMYWKYENLRSENSMPKDLLFQNLIFKKLEFENLVFKILMFEIVSQCHNLCLLFIVYCFNKVMWLLKNQITL